MRTSTFLTVAAAVPAALGAPKQPSLPKNGTLPKHFGLVVFPSFQALDVFGPLDVLNTLSMTYGDEAGMHLSILSTTMAPVTTKTVMTNRTMAMNMTHGDFGESIVPTTTFSRYLEERDNCTKKLPGHDEHHHSHVMESGAPMKKDLGDIDVLIIPGGGGTREPMTQEIDFIKKVYPKVKYIVSVCTGSTVVARTGLLDGKKATTNKKAWAWAVTQGPKTTWVPTARWVVDGNIWSSSGISAGIDVTYAFVEHVYGANVADYLADSLEYVRWKNATYDPFGKTWDVPGAH